MNESRAEDFGSDVTMDGGSPPRNGLPDVATGTAPAAEECNSVEARAEHPSLVSLIEKGESHDVEFKSTLRINMVTKERDTAIEHACLKTIAAFLNCKGGDLVIGVNDEYEILGIENDDFPKIDKMRLHLTNLIKHRIGTPAFEFIEMRPERVDDKEVLVIHCEPSSEPISCTTPEKKTAFFIRTDSQTNKLDDIREINAYLRRRFPPRRPGTLPQGPELPENRFRGRC